MTTIAILTAVDKTLRELSHVLPDPKPSKMIDSMTKEQLYANITDSSSKLYTSIPWDVLMNNENGQKYVTILSWVKPKLKKISTKTHRSLKKNCKHITTLIPEEIKNQIPQEWCVFIDHYFSPSFTLLCENQEIKKMFTTIFENVDFDMENMDSTIEQTGTKLFKYLKNLKNNHSSRFSILSNTINKCVVEIKMSLSEPIPKDIENNETLVSFLNQLKDNLNTLDPSDIIDHLLSTDFKFQNPLNMTTDV